MPPEPPAGPIRLRYGPAAPHFGDLRLPRDQGGAPHPVALLIHGGFCARATAST